MGMDKGEHDRTYNNKTAIIKDKEKEMNEIVANVMFIISHDYDDNRTI